MIVAAAPAGVGRLTEPQTLALARACGGHPLALHIAAAHLARRPSADAERFVRDIASPEHGVRALRAGSTAIGPVLERGFAALEAAQAHLFTILGTLPHMSVTSDVTSSTRSCTGSPA